LSGALDCAPAAVSAVELLWSGSGPATRGFDLAGVWVVMLLVLLTGVPSLLLAWTKRAPRTALALALAFPAGLIDVAIATVIAFM
jgi:hypothetical protein